MFKMLPCSRCSEQAVFVTVNATMPVVWNEEASRIECDIEWVDVDALDEPGASPTFMCDACHYMWPVGTDIEEAVIVSE